jgi:hypothetical protein
MSSSARSLPAAPRPDEVATLGTLLKALLDRDAGRKGE